MTDRTTIKTLRTIVANLNSYCGLPTEAYRREADGTLKAIPGVYVLDCAYGGGYRLRMVNETGGERDITPRYNAGITADLIRAYMEGLRTADLVRAKEATATTEGCPFKHSDMTPCVITDGDVCYSDDGHCVGCGRTKENILKSELPG